VCNYYYYFRFSFICHYFTTDYSSLGYGWILKFYKETLAIDEAGATATNKRHHTNHLVFNICLLSFVEMHFDEPCAVQLYANPLANNF